MPLDFVNEMHRASDWQQYAEEKEVFTHVYRDFIIPLWFIDIFCQALQLQPKAAATESKLQELLGDQPTLAGFKAGFKDAKTNSRPSISRMSGLSYNMLKSLPDIAVEYYHTCFIKFWLSDIVCASLKWRWMRTIPNTSVDNPSPADLRPLILCAVL